jgi:hypothetical protein
MSASANAKSHAVGKTLSQAELIRQVVQQHGFGHFKVRRKWPFHAPSHPSRAPDNQPMTLVAEFRDLVPIKDTRTRGVIRLPTAIGQTLRHNRERGGASYRPDNIPLTSEGRLHRYRAFALEAPRGIRGHINYGVKFLSNFTP